MGETASGVTYTFSTLRRRLGSSFEDAGIFFLFKPTKARTRTESAVVAAVNSAIQHANGAVSAEVAVGGVALNTQLGVGVNLFWGGKTNPGVENWFKVFARDLEAHGLGGKLTASPLSAFPSLATQEARAKFVPSPVPTAFVGYKPTGYPPRRTWGTGSLIDLQTVRRIGAYSTTSAQAIPDAKTLLFLANECVAIADHKVTDFLVTSAAHSSYDISVVHGSASPVPMSQITISARAQLIAQLIDPTKTWREVVNHMTEVLLIDPEGAQVGMIRPCGIEAISWQQLSEVEPRPVRAERDYSDNLHLWDKLVMDAHGVSLLTDKHLERANDLTDWDIKKVGIDRFLVTAKDLEPWYGTDTGVPDLDVLAKARADFGAMIMTWDDITAEPGPHTILHPGIIGR